MKKSKRIRPIIRVAESREQKAATELGRAQAQLREQLNRLQDLINYQSEYRARYEQTGRQGVSIQTLHSFNRFLAQLETAIEQQKQAVTTAQDLVSSRRQNWFASRDKVKIYSNVADNYISAENKQEEQQEQKDSDERAQRKP
jgi:flagellar FliJ protein